MKRLLPFFILFLLTSCVTNYYTTILSEDAALYSDENGFNSIMVIPQGASIYTSNKHTRYRKAKYGIHKGWIVNTNYAANESYKQSSKNYSTTAYSGSSNKATGGTVHVKSYTRKDGTHVQAHTRSAPRR